MPYRRNLSIAGLVVFLVDGVNQVADLCERVASRIERHDNTNTTCGRSPPFQQLYPTRITANITTALVMLVVYGLKTM